jgi:hypothetical protein
MLYMGIGTLSISSVADFAKSSIDESINHPQPEYITRNIYLKFGGDGIQIYVIFDVDKGKEEEALMSIMGRAIRFGLSIEDIKWTFEPIMTLEEGFTLLSTATTPD